MESADEVGPKETIKNACDNNSLFSSTEEVQFVCEIISNLKKVKKEEIDYSYETIEHNQSCMSNVSSQSTEHSIDNSNRAIVPRPNPFVNVSYHSTEQSIENSNKAVVSKPYPFANVSYQSTEQSVENSNKAVVPRPNPFVNVPYQSTEQSVENSNKAVVSKPYPFANVSYQSTEQSVENSNKAVVPRPNPFVNVPYQLTEQAVENSNKEVVTRPYPFANESYQSTEQSVDNSNREIIPRTECSFTNSAIPSVIEKNSNQISQQSNDNLVVTDPSGKNKRLKLVGNFTSFKRKNSQINVGNNYQSNDRNTPQISTNSSNVNMPTQLLPQNTSNNVVKKRRGRPKGQKNKKPSKKIGKQQLFETINQSKQPNSNQFVVYLQACFSVSDTEKGYNKRISKRRSKYQKDHNDYQRVDHSAPVENMAASLVYNTAQKKPRHQERECLREKKNTSLPTPEEDIFTTDINKVSETSISHANADCNVSSSAETPQSMLQDDAVDCNINALKTLNNSLKNSLQSQRPETNDSYELSSSDDEEPAFVYKMRDHATRNAIYSSNVLEECLNGNDSELMSSDKSLQMPSETYNNVSTSSSFNSNNVSCTYSGRDSPASSNFQNDTDNQMRQDENITFSENGTEHPENLDSFATSESCIDVGEGRIWPNTHHWDDFIELIYTQDNEKYYTFDPKNPTIVHFPLVKSSNCVLQSSEIVNEPLAPKRKEVNANWNNSLFGNNILHSQNFNDNRSLQDIIPEKDIDYSSSVKNMSNPLVIDEKITKTIEKTDYKLFCLEIRGNDKLGFDEIRNVSNSKCFECDNFTISYENIKAEKADVILNFCKPPHVSNLGHVEAREDANMPQAHTVCLWHANLMLSDPDRDPQDNNSFSQDASSLFETAQVAPEETIQVPCRRLIGLSDLAFNDFIHFVAKNKKISTLIETEISEYISDNASNIDSNMSQVQSLGRDETNVSLLVQESNNSTLMQPEMKLEPPDANHSFQSQSLPETRCSAYGNFTQQNTNTYNSHLSDDIIVIDDFTDVTQSGNYILRNNSNLSCFSTDANQNNWGVNMPQQSSDIEIGPHFAYKAHQHNNYSSNGSTLYRTDSDCSFEDARHITLEEATENVEKDITQAMVHDPGNFEREINSPNIDCFGNRSSCNSHKNYMLHEDLNAVTNPLFYPNVDYTSMKNRLEYQLPSSNIYQAPLLPTANNQMNSSGYRYNPYTEFSKTNKISNLMSCVPNSSVANIHLVNMRETGSLTNNSHNYAHQAFRTNNAGEMNLLNFGSSSVIPRQTQAGSNSVSYDSSAKIRNLEDFVQTFRAENPHSRRISKPSVEYNEIPTRRSRINTKMNAAFRFNSGGNIINQNIPGDKGRISSIKDFNPYNYATQYEMGLSQQPGLNFDAMNSIQTPPPMNLSLSQFPQLPSTSQIHLKPSDNFSGESLAYKSSGRANSQRPNDLTINGPQNSVLENYSMCASNEQPLNLHVSRNTGLVNFGQNVRHPNNYHPYNEFQTTSRGGIDEHSRESESLRNDNVSQQYHFLGLTRQSYQKEPGKIMDSDACMANSFSNMMPTEFTEQMYQESDITGIPSYYASDSQYEDLTPKIIQDISPERTATECIQTITTQIEHAVLSKKEREPQAQKLIENRPKNSYQEKKNSAYNDPKEILRDFYKGDPYPTQTTRVMLATKTGMMEKQVNTWFKNRRQRERRINGFVREGSKGGRKPKHSKSSPSSKKPSSPKPSAPSMPIFPTTFSTNKHTSQGS